MKVGTELALLYHYAFEENIKMPKTEKTIHHSTNDMGKKNLFDVRFGCHLSFFSFLVSLMTYVKYVV